MLNVIKETGVAVKYSVNKDDLGLMGWRTELIPDEMPTLKQKAVAAWQKLQGMAIACEDLGWEAKMWLYDHPEETKKVKYALAVAALGLLAGLAVVSGTEWLSELKLPK
jgi:hypothetical protein